MDDLISRENAIKEIIETYEYEFPTASGAFDEFATMIVPNILRNLPSAEPEQTKMIKEIREWINSGNRGSADYFIVDKIEEVINKYE